MRSVFRVLFFHNKHFALGDITKIYEAGPPQPDPPGTGGQKLPGKAFHSKPQSGMIGPTLQVFRHFSKWHDACIRFWQLTRFVLMVSTVA
jgi:hypothetical protein